MAPGSLLTLAGLAAVAGTSSAFLHPLSRPSTRVAPRSNTLAGSRSYGTRMTVRRLPISISLCDFAGKFASWLQVADPEFLVLQIRVQP